LPWPPLPVDVTCHIAVASQRRGLHIVDIPLADVGLTAVDIGSGFGKEGWERRGWGVVVAYEAAGLRARSWTRRLGLHSGVMFDKHPGDVARCGAGYEVVDTVLDIPSLMPVVEGRRGPPTREDNAMEVGEAGT
jgi:hypothetical protein